VFRLRDRTPEVGRTKSEPVKGQTMTPAQPVAGPPLAPLAPAPAPGVERVRLSEALWGIRWSDLLPFDLGGGAHVRVSSLTAAAPFVRDHYARIFEDDGTSPFRNDVLTPIKARYYDLCADFFEFVLDGSTVGLLVCDPLDWSTYYIRSAAILPEHQGRALVQRFFTNLAFERLAQAGVSRADIDVSPSNVAMLHIATRLRFNPTGTVLTERWGALTRFTKFLSRDAHQVFLEQFCSGVNYQRRVSRTRDAVQG